MQNKWLRRALIAAVVVTLIWFIVPLFFNKRVNESREAISSQPVTVSTTQPEAVDSAEPVANAEPKGTFTGLTGHRSSGTATLIRSPNGSFIRLEDDFSVTSGPDLYVYAGNSSGKTSEVARLKGNQGSQNYELPHDLDPESITSVWIYCKAFRTDFAKADLKY
jgi:hypothetical protein